MGCHTLQTLKILEHDSYGTFGTDELYRRTSLMPQQEQDVLEGINRTGKILATSQLIGFDQQPFLVVQSSGLSIQQTSYF
jgi:hypothetical protein